MSKRRGRERVRDRDRGCETEAWGGFVVSVDLRTGSLMTFGHSDPAVSTPEARDEVTRWVIATLAKYGFVPEDPMQIRDALWE